MCTRDGSMNIVRGRNEYRNRSVCTLRTRINQFRCANLYSFSGLCIHDCIRFYQKQIVYSTYPQNWAYQRYKRQITYGGVATRKLGSPGIHIICHFQQHKQTDLTVVPLATPQSRIIVRIGIILLYQLRRGVKQNGLVNQQFELSGKIKPAVYYYIWTNISHQVSQNKRVIESSYFVQMYMLWEITKTIAYQTFSITIYDYGLQRHRQVNCTGLYIKIYLQFTF